MFKVKRAIFLAIAVWLMSFVVPVNAGCRCACVDGESRAICSGSFDIKPSCKLLACPWGSSKNLDDDSVQTPKMSFPGISRCVKRQIYNDQIHAYEWKDVCS